MCQKCFGERKFMTKYLGIVCGQTISERLTQLVLRTFHTSGAAELKVILTAKEFMKQHLIDIENNKNSDKIILTFDSNKIPDAIQKIQGYENFVTIDDKTLVFFDHIHDTVYNNDTISMLRNIQNLLKQNKTPNKHPVEFYLELMELVMTVGTPYSSFVEMVFANMFMTNKEENKFWRYNPDDKIVLKLGDKILAKQLRALLGLLYQPNKNTIAEMDKLEDIDIDNADLTIYEKIFLSRL
jgi:hypothetical protein